MNNGNDFENEQGNIQNFMPDGQPSQGVSFDKPSSQINRDDFESFIKNGQGSNEQFTNSSSYSSNFQVKDEKPKKKINWKLIIPISLVILIILFIFVIFPFIRDNMINNPEHVFNSAIDSTFETVNSYIYIDNQNSVNEINGTIDTNIDELKDYSNYKYNFRFGSDSQRNLSEYKFTMTDKNNKKYSFGKYVKDFRLYEDYSSFDKFIDLGKYEDIDFSSLVNFNKDDITYLTSKMSEVLKESLDKSRFSKGSKTIEVNGKKIGVSKNSYELDSKEIQRLTKCVLNGLYKDDKALDIIIKANNISKGEFKERIDKIDDEFSNSIDGTINNYSGSFFLNIYMNGFGFAGMDIEMDKQTIVSYYTDSGNFSFNIPLATIIIDGTKNDKTTNVDIMYGGNKIMTLDVRSFEGNNIDFDYMVSNISGSLSYKTSGSNGDLKLSYKNGIDYFNMDIKKSSSSNFTVIDEEKVVNLSDEEYEKVQSDFINSLGDTPLGNIIFGMNTDDMFSENSLLQ